MANEAMDTDKGRLIREAELSKPATRPALREIGKSMALVAFRTAERRVEQPPATELKRRGLTALCCD
jgi:hypothetical protein